MLQDIPIPLGQQNGPLRPRVRATVAAAIGKPPTKEVTVPANHLMSPIEFRAFAMAIPARPRQPTYGPQGPQRLQGLMGFQSGLSVG